MKTFYKTILLLIYNLTFIFYLSFSQQSPGIEWAKCYGGDSTDWSHSVFQTSDGGYILAGQSWSINGDVTGNHGTVDYWIVKLDSVGILEWQKSLGGPIGDVAQSAQQTYDGGYIISGHSTSTNGNVSGNHGGGDYWVIKLNSNGNIQWKKCYGGTDDERYCKVVQTPDSGYILCGQSSSYNGQVTGNHGSDIWVVKINGNGILEWQKCLGGSSLEYGNDIALTSDHGYIVAGRTWSNDGDLSGNHDTLGNASDCWVAKIDSMGNLQWQKCLGGTYYDEAFSIQQTSDLGYIVAGLTASFNGDVSGNHGHEDYWIVKLDNSGNMQWQKCLGGMFDDAALSILQTFNGDYVVAGYTTSNDGDVSGYHDTAGLATYGDAWIVKLNSTGNLLWQKCYGGTSSEGANSLKQTLDGDYVFAGSTNSNDGDVPSNNDTIGYTGNYWIVKLLPDTITSISDFQIPIFNFQIFPNPSSGIFQITLPNQKTNYTLEVINTLGQTVFKDGFSSVSKSPSGGFRGPLDLSFLPKGIYVLRLCVPSGKINDGVSALSSKFVIE